MVSGKAKRLKASCGNRNPLCGRASCTYASAVAVACAQSAEAPETPSREFPLGVLMLPQAKNKRKGIAWKGKSHFNSRR